MFKRKSNLNLKNNEKIILFLPKKCGCHTCELVKKDLKDTVGFKRFKEPCIMSDIIF